MGVLLHRTGSEEAFFFPQRRLIPHCSPHSEFILNHVILAVSSHYHYLKNAGAFYYSLLTPTAPRRPLLCTL